MRHLLIVVFIALLAAFPFVSAESQEKSQGWGSIKGRLVWNANDIPVAKRIVNPAIFPGVEVFDDQLLVNAKNRGIRHGLVWLMPQGIEPLKVHPDLQAIKSKEVQLVIRKYQYDPPVVAIREGQNLLVKTDDPWPYNFRWTGNDINPDGQVLLGQGRMHVIEGLRPQKLPMQVGSDGYPWMCGGVAIIGHPYFAVTGEDGQFEIKLAPPGRVRVFVWQLSLGWLGGSAGRNGYEHVIPSNGALDLGDLKMKR